MSAVVKIDQYHTLSKKAATGVDYKGLPIYALPVLHETVGNKAKEWFPSGCRVLDLACGSGALTQRLRDGGFEVESADLVSEGFRLHGQGKFYTADFNSSFRNLVNGPYDAITALEIIEHLENPRHFVRECMALLKPGGFLILSTPNIDSPRSILRFVTKGHFRQFSEDDYTLSGHITPLSQWQIEKIIAEGKWIVKQFTSCGLPFEPGLRHLSAKMLCALMAKNPRLRGALLLLVLQKPA
jgi:2-polyprenyl-3-methyl-5-hydroxy-6-metoxy-1,4-benzoquinol methylase